MRDKMQLSQYYAWLGQIHSQYNNILLATDIGWFIYS